MEPPAIEKDGSVLGGLFHQIITDMKNGTPLWEDFASKATKLHTCLRAALQAIAAYLDAFQKIADAATNARGATKDIGTALTRICLRHKAVEARVKTFTCAIMDCLVLPLQEKLEDWRKAVINLDKEHAKEYKKARSDLKKRSTDTLRLQKKAKKGNSRELQNRVESCLQDVSERKHTLAEAERRAARAALIAERARYCEFFGLLEPVVHEEVAMLTELSHLQESVTQLRNLTKDPHILPPSSEQIVLDAKGWSPPGSPDSLGSRKSSVCSISSLNSSSSGSGHALSPSQPHWQRSLSQPHNRLSRFPGDPLASRDSGFTSQDTLHPSAQVSTVSSHSTGSGPGISTWPPLPDTTSSGANERPHTISSAYERGHQRPALTVYTFQAPEQSLSQPASPLGGPTLSLAGTPHSRPPLPTRCSSLERPGVPNKVSSKHIIQEKSRPSPLPAHLAKEIPQPTYVNMHELATLAANKAQNMQLPPPPPEVTEKTDVPDGSSDSSMESSSGYGSQSAVNGPNQQGNQGQGCNTVTIGQLYDDGQDACLKSEMSELSSSLQSVNMIKYDVTIPVDQIRRRPVSVAGYPQRGSQSRRGSNVGVRPPPPVRRTASISMPRQPVPSLITLSQHNQQVNEALPPPPAFMLEAPGSPVPTGGAVAETVKALTELRHTPASPNVLRKASAINNLQQSTPFKAQHPEQSPSGSTFGQKFTYNSSIYGSPSSLNSSLASINQSISNNTSTTGSTFSSGFSIYGQSPLFGKEPSQIMSLNQTTSPVASLYNNITTPKVLSSFSQNNSSGGIYAQPSSLMGNISGSHPSNQSPGTPRRNSSFRSQSAERKDGPGGVGTGFMAQLSARLAPQLSPRAPRRLGHTTEVNQSICTVKQQNNSKGTALLLQRGGQGFIDTLNARLAQQQALGGPTRALQVRQTINNTAQPDPTVCHESLMEQIKRGATLRRNRTINDRSAPKIH